MEVGPSKNQEEWREFLYRSSSWKPEEFQALLSSEPPGVALFEVEAYINGLYQAVPPFLDPGEVSFRAEWISMQAEIFRRNLDWRQRDLDLGLLQWIRRASCLSIVAGAGVTMAAGGPSWKELIRELLTLALKRGHEITRMVPEPGNTPERMSFKPEVVEIRHFDAASAKKAKAALSAIESDEADTEILMEGAQLCYDLMGQDLFTDITQILYADKRKPGPVHRAIAKLAHPQYVPDRGGWFPGLHAIITYNFEDLLGEALDEEGLARVSFAMRGDEIAGDPNELAQKQEQDGLYQRIFHLHGYTPRRPFVITKVGFVFSTSQYSQIYAPNQRTIIDQAFEYSLANPVHHALYVGCSFQDEAMNNLLAQAADRLPGRFHYALLKWPEKRPYREATPKEIDYQNLSYRHLGIRPLWFDDYSEIPELITATA
jgi:hypothetical protein